MEVILLERVGNLGQFVEVVRQGRFARNLPVAQGQSLASDNGRTALASAK